ncbi:MAG: amino acid ABC transporter substrate-binding protein [Gemmatimonadetes bacterium]|nr:amino acid ABC transporter substrate-binding protein [Gemmatimonadota bacterium]
MLQLGVLVPAGGEAYLQQYSEAVLEGVKVATEELNATGDFRVELVVRPVADATAAAAAVRELGGTGVIGIIGPLLDANITAAAAARPDTALAVVSPTAATAFATLPNVYALNVPDTLGAAALGDFAARSGLTPVAVLRPRSGGAAALARSFANAFLRRTGGAPQELTFEPGTTNYSATLRRLREARVKAVFAASEESDLRQFLPQVSYYGVGGAQLLATGPWATPDGLERIGLRLLEGVITTLPFLPADSAGTWGRFVRRYEEANRRSLDSAIPALGYDAAALLLMNPGDDAAKIARRLRAGTEVTGATGHLVPLRGSVGRRPLLVRITGGRLVPQMAP